MHRHWIPRLFAVCVCAAAVCASAGAQSEQSADALPPGARVVPADKRPVPFALNSARGEAVSTIDFRTPEQMSEQDRTLATDAESSIADRAGFADLEFNEGKWSYRQVVCPALPNHLFLRFERNEGPGNVSMFSASIPRNGQGRVRIIPILRRSYSLFAPAPINAMTLAAFNHIRAEEGPDAGADWLGTGLCYAALAGANPQMKPVDTAQGSAAGLSSSEAILEVQVKGGAIIRFSDWAARPHPRLWQLDFNGKGKLLKVTRTPFEAPRVTPVPAASTMVMHPVPEGPTPVAVAVQPAR